MNSHSIITVVVSFAMLASAFQASQRQQEPSVVGTWRLVSYEDRPAQGPMRLPYGTNPKGLLMYDATGHMSIQIMKQPRHTVASGDDEQVTNEEKIALFDAYRRTSVPTRSMRRVGSPSTTPKAISPMSSSAVMKSGRSS